MKSYFLTGLVVLAPVVITLLIVKWLFSFLDGWLDPVVQGVVGHRVPGLGIVATALLIGGVGFVASHVIGRKLVDFFDALFLHLPILSNLYKTLKQVMDLFSPERHEDLKGVVMVEYPKTGVYSLGFVTQEIELSEEGRPPQEMVSVFVPTNQLYLGFTVVVKKSEAIPTGLSIQEGIQCILTAGGSFPKKLSPR